MINKEYIYLSMCYNEVAAVLDLSEGLGFNPPLGLVKRVHSQMQKSLSQTQKSKKTLKCKKLGLIPTKF